MPYLRIPPSLSEAEIDAKEQALEAALLAAYAGARFEKLEASVQDCEISFRRMDTNHLHYPSALVAGMVYYDLARMQPVMEKVRETELEGIRMLRVKLEPVGDWADERAEIRA